MVTALGQAAMAANFAVAGSTTAKYQMALQMVYFLSFSALFESIAIKLANMALYIIVFNKHVFSEVFNGSVRFLVSVFFSSFSAKACVHCNTKCVRLLFWSWRTC